MYLKKMLEQNLLGGQEEKKEHDSQSMVQKIFNFNFNCVIVAFSVVCVSVNIAQMKYLEGDDKIQKVGHFVNAANTQSQSVITEEEIAAAIGEPDVIDPLISLETEQAIVPNLIDFKEEEAVEIELIPVQDEEALTAE